MKINPIIFIVFACALGFVLVGFILGSISSVQLLHAEKLQKTICLAELQQRTFAFDNNGLPVIDFNSSEQVMRVYDKNFFECFLE